MMKPRLVQITQVSCALSVLWLFPMVMVTRVGLQCVIVTFPTHTHLLYDSNRYVAKSSCPAPKL